jgi:hypothetical protein
MAEWIMYRHQFPPSTVHGVSQSHHRSTVGQQRTDM